MQTVAMVVALAVMIAGLAGTFVPAIPGLPLIWLAMLGYGAVEGFRAMTPGFLVIALILVIGSQAAEHYARAWGAKRWGAGRAGIWGAVIGSIAGLFFPPIGLILGPFLGAALFELLAGRNTGEALRAGWGGVIGVLSSVVINVLLALSMIVAFLWKVLT